MKHLLNDLSEEERNNIREQHAGGMKVSNARFNTLLETKSGDVKPFISEQSGSMKLSSSPDYAIAKQYFTVQYGKDNESPTYVGSDYIIWNETPIGNFDNAARYNLTVVKLKTVTMKGGQAVLPIRVGTVDFDFMSKTFIDEKYDTFNDYSGTKYSVQEINDAYSSFPTGIVKIVPSYKKTQEGQLMVQTLNKNPESLKLLKSQLTGQALEVYNALTAS